MTLLALPVMFLVTQGIFGLQTTWKTSGADRLYSATSNIVNTSNNLPRMQCAAACTQDYSCLSFNHHGVRGSCQLMNRAPYPATTDPALVTSTGWSHYIISGPRKVLDENICAEGGVYLPYNVPATGYNTNVEGYTCSSHPWIFKQYSLGKTDCRFAIMNQVDLAGNDIMAYYFAGPFDRVLHGCRNTSCASMVCHNQNECYLKYESHLTLGVSLVVNDRVFWYVLCQ